MNIINIMIDTILYLIFAVYIYNVFLTIISVCFRETKDDYEKNNYRHKSWGGTKFLILIPAHNEEDVIADNIAAIEASLYDPKLYKIIVIDDRSSDDTVHRVNMCDLYYSHLDIDMIHVDGGSKPKAINMAVELIKNSRPDIWAWTDHVVIVDADNKISNRLLLEYHSQIATFGHKILQCRIRSDNNDSIVAKGFTCSFNMMAMTSQRARTRLGLSAYLSGTGFSVDKNIWDKVGFSNCDTITEDLEFTILCIIAGYKVRYIDYPTVYVLNQNLDHVKPSIVQRVRWCRGHVQTYYKLRKEIIKQMFIKPSIQLVDAFVILSTPNRSLMYLIGTVLSFGFTVKHLDLMYLSIALVIYNAYLLYVSNDRDIKLVFSGVIYSVSMTFIMFFSVITYKRSYWIKTKHVKIN